MASLVLNDELSRAAHSIEGLGMTMPEIRRQPITGGHHIVNSPYARLAKQSLMAQLALGADPRILSMRLVAASTARREGDIAQSKTGALLYISAFHSGTLLVTSCFGNPETVPKVTIPVTRYTKALGVSVELCDVGTDGGEDPLAVHCRQVGELFGVQDNDRVVGPADAIRLAVLLHWLPTPGEMAYA